jgi:hypothetical protein
MDRRTGRNFVAFEQGGWAQRSRIKRAVHGNERAVRLGRAQDDKAIGRPAFKTLRHQAGTGMSRRETIGVFIAVDEREIGRSGEFERGDVLDQVFKPQSIAGFGTRQRNDLGYCQTRRAFKEAACAHIPIPSPKSDPRQNPVIESRA